MQTIVLSGIQLQYTLDLFVESMSNGWIDIPIAVGFMPKRIAGWSIVADWKRLFNVIVSIANGQVKICFIWKWMTDLKLVGEPPNRLWRSDSGIDSITYSINVIRIAWKSDSCLIDLSGSGKIEINIFIHVFSNGCYPAFVRIAKSVSSVDF